MRGGSQDRIPDDSISVARVFLAGPTVLDPARPHGGISRIDPLFPPGEFDADVARQHQHKIHRYTVLARVGAGAMGVVYAAYDPDLDRQIALKLLAAPDAGRGKARERMLAEARALARVAHPNVVGVFETGIVQRDAGEAVFVAMEFVRGRTLRAWCEQAQPDWRAVVLAYAQAGRGLAAVHRMGLVHRDFKPDNAMIDDDGRVRVMDFGLACDDVGSSLPSTTASDSDAVSDHVTRTGALVGTPAYMAPEQLVGCPADARTDQWALCVSLYEALWGRRPFEADTLEGLAEALLAGGRLPEPTTNVGVPRAIRLAIERGLAATADARWPSLDALADALEMRGNGRSRWLGVAAAGTALVIGGVAWLVTAPASSPCSGSQTAFADAWNDDIASRLHAAFAAPAVDWIQPVVQDTERKLDAFARGWTDQHHAACQAARVEHTQSDGMLDRRMRCLERGRRDFVALVDALAEPDLPWDAEGLERANAAVRTLSPPQRCGDAAFLDAPTPSPPPPAVADAVQVLRRQLADLHAAYTLGRAGSAISRTAGLIDAAAKTAYAPVIAEAHLAVGEVLFAAEQLESARAELTTAYFSARPLVDRTTAARAATSLASLTGGSTDEHALARQWLKLAELELAPDAFEARANLAGLEVGMLLREGKWDAAVAAAERQLADLAGDCPAPCEARPDIHGRLARLYSRLGRVGEAERHARTALELESDLHDGDHPHRARALNGLGEILDRSERYGESLELLQGALQMRARMLGPDHTETAITRIRLATTLVSLGRGDEAVQQAERAVQAVRTRPEPLALAALLGELAGVHSDLDHPAQARAGWEEALAIHQRLYPDGDPTQAVLLSNIAMTARALGDLPGAWSGYEAALAMRRKHVTGRDPERAFLLVNAGRTLLDLGRDAEGIVSLRQAVALAQGEEIRAHIVTAQIWRWKALRDPDPAGAAAVLAEVRAQCAAASEVARSAAGCDRLDTLVAPDSR